jgi:hypothetical protein
MRVSRSSFASASFSIVGALACGRAGVAAEDAAGLHASAEASGGSVPAASAPAPSAPAPSPALPASAEAADAYVTALPTAAKSIGHTSYVLKLKLVGGAVAAFKPRSRRPLGERRYKGEIAAYRLAVALGIDNVPRAIPRSFDAAPLRALLGASFDREAIVDADGKVRGALMPWIESYRVLPLEEAGQRARWEPWLFDPRAEVPEAARRLASAVSTMIAFDYLTANWDRWSGGNVAEEGADGRVLYVDNDGAFYEWPDAHQLARQRRELERVVRYSRRFVAALRALEDETLERAVGDEEPGAPLLSERARAGVEARRKTVLSIIDARVGDAGEAAALPFE